MSKITNRDKHYKKIGIKRYIRIFLRKLFFGTFLVLFLSIAGFATYDPDLFNSKFDHYVNLISNELNFSLNKIEVHESTKYCTSIKPFLANIEPGTSIFLVSITEIKSELEQLDCVNKVMISREYPDTILIEVEEERPVAIWQSERKFYYVNEDGSIMSIRTLQDIERFLIVTGKNAPINAPDLVSFLEINPEIMIEVTSAVWVGDRRWNVRLKDGMTVMLPEKSPEVAWNKFIKMSTHPELKEGKYTIIDLRIDGRVYTK